MYHGQRPATRAVAREALMQDGDDQGLFVGRFVIEKEAGRGGVGIVHRAIDRGTGQTVALKVLHKIEPSTLRRFAMEADALEKLNHPNIVRYVTHGIAEDEAPYLAMEWVEGECLRARVDRATQDGERLPIADIVELGQHLAGALEAAHAQGIVHRDVKPNNILLEGGDLRRPKLVDFGIVRAESAEHATTTGAMLGTVGYMAPEQARGVEHLDGRADLFSLGCVLFRCLANRDAFTGPDPVTTLSMLLMHAPPRLAELRPDVPPDLDALVGRLLAKEPSMRPPSAASVKQALARTAIVLAGGAQTSSRLFGASPKSRATTPSARVRRPLAWAGAIFGLVLLGIAGALLPWCRRRPEPPPVTAIPPPPTSLTALPASPSCDPHAVTAYQQGLQALHDGRWDQARRFFELAAQTDGACPQALLRRLLIEREHSDPISLRREHLREAVRLRDALSERDRLVLDAFGLVVAEDTPPLREEAVRILDEAVRRFPMDAEVLFRSAGERMNVARSPEDFEIALARVRRAAELDPSYSDAWQAQARILEHLGREEELRAALDQCLAMSPGSVDCMADRVFALSRTGHCGEAATEARRRSSWDPDEPQVYRSLAETLAATRAPKEAIEQVLSMRANRLPVPTREEASLLDQVQLEAWAGQFDLAVATAEQLENLLASSSARESHWIAALESAEALFEVGETDRAARIAENAYLRKDAWVPDKTISVSAAPMEAWLLAAALRGGRRTESQWRAATRGWERANEGPLSAFERWVLKWGTRVDSPKDAAQAMADAPSGEPREGARHFHVAWRIGLLDAYAGRIFLQAGDPARAAPLLEKGAHACQGIAYPFLNVRAHLWLGMAKEKLGDTAAACGAYRVVLDRWGHTTPRSITAREAEQRRRALGCK
ncbi:protein kinase domain-containing protein [Pendulispora albinea]|uniref:Protein kinase n=1 Tax=Pendulispora albinea TaxID=2741071 RepID=A0ABZ2MBW9_9BACT